jgi:hypothetical protein
MRVTTALATLSATAFLAWAGCATYSGVMFDLRCGNYLQRAANSNTVELAHQNLQVAVKYMEANSMTAGNTGALWDTPNQDVGFWYTNLTASLDELKQVRPDASQLERSNLLMKLRETLLDNGSSGDSLTVPTGISVFPFNTLFFFWSIISGMLTVFFGFWRLSDEM